MGFPQVVCPAGQGETKSEATGSIIISNSIKRYILYEPNIQVFEHIARTRTFLYHNIVTTKVEMGSGIVDIQHRPLKGDVKEAARQPLSPKLALVPGQACGEGDGRTFVPRFPYYDLNAKRRDIRILTLLGGSKDEYSLRHVSLDDKDLQYEALSYAWGSGQQRSMIYVDGHPMVITETLKSALSCLRETENRFLWIDQICINQTDLAERGSQVGMMALIYSRAENVVVWLGSEVAQEALWYLKAYDMKLGHHESLPEPEELANEREKCSGWGFKLQHFKNNRMLILELMRLPWFSRVWVIQEVAVARKVTVQIQQWSLPWESFCQSFETLKDRHDINSTGEGIKMINKLRAGWAQKDIGTELLCLLERFRHYEASDKRDKVYAILGLASSSTAGRNTVKIQSDYSKTTREVYKLVATKHIKRRQNLDILSYVIRDTTLSTSLPSWVPDWSFHDTGLVSLPKYKPKSGDAEPFYNICGLLKLNPELLSEVDLSESLVLEGFVFDTVSEVGNSAMSAEDLGLGAGRTVAWESRIMQEWKSLAEQRWEIYGSSAECAFWRTLVADVIGEDRIGRDDTEFAALAACAVRYGFSARSEEESAKYKELYLCVAALKRTAVKRAFFFTKKGYMGLGPASMHIGDKVYILAGSRVPFVLRAAEDMGVYSLVGESYVHGIMDGEATEGEVDLETICLI